MIWALFYAACYLAEHFQTGYKVPEGLAKVVVSVVGIFFGTGISKRYFGMLRGEGADWGSLEAEAARINDEEELRRQAILRLLKASKKGLSAPELAKGSAASHRAVLRYLTTLMKEKKVVSFGKARSIRYRMK